jgi:hypothetical protein
VIVRTFPNKDKRRQAEEQYRKLMFLILKSQPVPEWIKGTWQVSKYEQSSRRREE